MDALLASPYWPFAVLLLAIAAVVLMITILRFHAFVALILSAIFVGLISQDLSPLTEGQHALVTAIELPMVEFGVTAGKIAWVIALAAIIGTAMIESGAAERIVNSLLAALGEKRAPIALVISGFILSIPVFFDTVFFLLIPLAIALTQKTGKHFLLYVLTIGGGAVITHSLVPPTPGPLIMAETLNLDLGLTILAGLAAGVIPVVVVLWVAKRMDQRFNLPLRVGEIESKKAVNPPGLFLSLLPVLIPILLISLASITEVLTGRLPGWIAFLGNKNIAMAIGTAMALWLWANRQNLDGHGIWKAVAKPLEIAGIIILITSAGGAFGAMIKASGIGNAIELATADFQINYILLAWIIAAVMKTAQGSSTVSMITSAGIILGLMESGVTLPYHPMYVLLSIGFGALFVSWMNDSGFWVVARMSGFTEKEALSTWTVMIAILSVVGLIQLMIFAAIFPFV
jgi:GntP family gluconate:H+ symporter